MLLHYLYLVIMKKHAQFFVNKRKQNIYTPQRCREYLVLLKEAAT